MTPDRLDMTRRDFGRVAGLSALSATIPLFVQKTGWALGGDPRRQIPPLQGLRDNHVLVLIQLSG